MSKISYIDDDFKYAKAFIKRDFTEIKYEVLNSTEDLNFSFEDDNKIYGYKITRNKLLSDSYGIDFFVIHFCFVDIETLHDSRQEKCIYKLLVHLMEEIDIKKGYYNLKLPTHIVDLIRAYNLLNELFIFCGGTVEQYIFNKKALYEDKSGLNIYMAGKTDIEKYYDELLEMTYSSFETYQGQYHLSYVIGDRAGDVYKNWIKESLNPESSEKIIITKCKDKPIGFVTIKEDDFAVQGVLSAVLSEYRQYGAYKAMIANIINYAFDNRKSFITGTQFDNFIVQGAWNSLEMRPFYSFYNIHINKS